MLSWFLNSSKRLLTSQPLLTRFLQTPDSLNEQEYFDLLTQLFKDERIDIAEKVLRKTLTLGYFENIRSRLLESDVKIHDIYFLRLLLGKDFKKYVVQFTYKFQHTNDSTFNHIDDVEETAISLIQKLRNDITNANDSTIIIVWLTKLHDYQPLRIPVVLSLCNKFYIEQILGVNYQDFTTSQDFSGAIDLLISYNAPLSDILTLCTDYTILKLSFEKNLDTICKNDNEELFHYAHETLKIDFNLTKCVNLSTAKSTFNIVDHLLVLKPHLFAENFCWSNIQTIYEHVNIFQKFPGFVQLFTIFWNFEPKDAETTLWNFVLSKGNCQVIDHFASEMRLPIVFIGHIGSIDSFRFLQSNKHNIKVDWEKTTSFNSIVLQKLHGLQLKTINTHSNYCLMLGVLHAIPTFNYSFLDLIQTDQIINFLSPMPKNQIKTIKNKAWLCLLVYIETKNGYFTDQWTSFAINNNLVKILKFLLSGELPRMKGHLSMLFLSLKSDSFQCTRFLVGYLKNQMPNQISVLECDTRSISILNALLNKIGFNQKYSFSPNKKCFVKF